MKKKILFVINQLYKGGAETSLVTMLKNLSPARFDVDLAVFDQQTDVEAISLLPEVPEYVHLWCFGTDNSVERLIDGGKRRLAGSTDSLIQFVRRRNYDLAISYGEWFSPELVMKYANAEQKAIWLHSDIAQLPLENLKELFRYDYITDYYICVSKTFAQRIGNDFAFMKDRLAIIHNVIDSEKILRMAEESCEITASVPVILSVGNLRPEKNYIRAVVAASLLKQKNIPFKWFCVGAFSYEPTVSEVKKTIRQHGLENDFLLLGPAANPYSFMRRANVLVSSSNYESWSMIISEAKIVKLPIICTCTDGAEEQLVHAENALLCDFTEQDLAEKIETFLENPALQQKFRNNLRKNGADCRLEQEISVLFQKKTLLVSLLTIIDDINYRSGAHSATRNLLKRLMRLGYQVEIFSGTYPTVESRNFYAPVRISTLPAFPATELDTLPFRYCIFSQDYSWKQKRIKFYNAVMKRVYPKKSFIHYRLNRGAKEFFSKYPRICIMSEGSVFRQMVSVLPFVRKIQMIHTHYQQWITLNDFVRNLTEHDGEIYEKMDRVLLISKASRDSFVEKFPSFARKSFAVRNVIEFNCPSQKLHYEASKVPRLLTLARLEREKDIPRMIRLARRLKEDKIPFDWRVCGFSTALSDFCHLAEENEVSDIFHLNGFSDQPIAELYRAELFVLLSHYEGLPNTIFEAFLTGLPVFATAVGGIGEQVTDGVNGVLVENNEDKIYMRLKEMLQHPDRIAQLRENLKEYRYDNAEITHNYIKLFDLAE